MIKNNTKLDFTQMLTRPHSLKAPFSTKSFSYVALKFGFRFYKIIISPLLPRSCRFYPTCSHYAYLSFRHSTPFSAFIATLWRILRCQPFCNGGFDYPIISTNLKNTASRSAIIDAKKSEKFPRICVWLVSLKSQIDSKTSPKVNSKADSTLFQKMIAKKKTSKYIIIPN